jgi:DHA1 family multidrug resistance protein-like MFS transporter
MLPETLYSNLLHRRAQRVRRVTSDFSWVSQGEIDQGDAHILNSMGVGILEDFRMSFADPVILFVNLHTMLIYGVLYLWFEFFPFGRPGLPRVVLGNFD